MLSSSSRRIAFCFWCWLLPFSVSFGCLFDFHFFVLLLWLSSILCFGFVKAMNLYFSYFLSIWGSWCFCYSIDEILIGQSSDLSFEQVVDLQNVQILVCFWPQDLMYGSSLVPWSFPYHIDSPVTPKHRAFSPELLISPITMVQLTLLDL